MVQLGDNERCVDVFFHRQFCIEFSIDLLLIFSQIIKVLMTSCTSSINASSFLDYSINMKFTFLVIDVFEHYRFCDEISYL